MRYMGLVLGVVVGVAVYFGTKYMADAGWVRHHEAIRPVIYGVLLGGITAIFASGKFRRGGKDKQPPEGDGSG